MKYEEPMVTVIYLEMQDVLTTSSPKKDQGETGYEDPIERIEN